MTVTVVRDAASQIVLIDGGLQVNYNPSTWVMLTLCSVPAGRQINKTHKGDTRNWYLTIPLSNRQ